MSDKIRELVEAMKEQANQTVKATIRVARVKEVDWDNKTMVAIGVSDELEYYDVMLGIGGVYVKPKKNTLCLIGIIENKEEEAFLIEAEEVEEISLKSVKITINDGLNKGLVILDALVTKLNRIEEKHNALVAKYNTHIHVTTATIGAGPAVGVLSPTATQSSDYATPVTTAADIENDKVTH